MRIFLTALLTGMVYPLLACINYMGVTVDGKHVTIDASHYSGHFLHYPSRTDKSEKALRLQNEKLLAELKAYPDKIPVRNDLAVTRIFLGDYDTALVLLKHNYILSANNYATLANLGVVYELKGKLDSAYHYTARAFEINKESHHGSEWIHLRLLETAMHANPQMQLENFKMLGIDFGKEATPSRSAVPGRVVEHRIIESESRSRWDTVTRLVHDLEYQLQERTFFIKNNDPYIGELFFTLADLYSLYYDRYWALWAYTKALQYGTAHDDIVIKRGKYLYQRLKNVAKPSRNQHSTTIMEYNTVMRFWRQMK